MIILLEPVCSAWVHEEVNAGFLKLVCENTDQKVLYVGEKEHLRCVKRIWNSKRVEYKALVKTVPQEEADSYENTFYYLSLFRDVLVRYKPDILFILCGYRPCILAAEIISIFFLKTKINQVIHGMIEEKKGKTKSYARLFANSLYVKNLDFVTYSPYCTDAYWKLKKNKFVFLDHPYIKVKNDTSVLISSDNSDTTRIGIVGACANTKAFKLISMVNRCNLDHAYEFWIISKYGNRFKKLENVKVLELEFDRINKNRMICNMDYLLMPYGSDEYRQSASGVLWDAISNRIPCLMLDCKYFEYYSSYKIGYQAEDLRGLCKIVCEKIQNKKEKDATLFVGIDKIEDERCKTMQDLLGVVYQGRDMRA